jgi:hypothetical protein
MVPGMIFLFALRSLLSQRWAALKEVSAAVAAAIGKAHWNASLHASYTDVPSTLDLTRWRGSVTL